MAKKSIVNRNLKRQRTVARYAARRQALKAILSDPKSSDEERADAQRKFQQLPRDASPVRLRNRCRVTGRGKGVYSKFGLSRTKLREAAMRGEVPGLVKSSW